MSIEVLNFFIKLLLILIPIYGLYKIRILNYKIIYNLKYFLLFYAYFYTLLPAIFLEYTNNLQNWNFTEEILKEAKVYSILFNIILLTLVLFCKDIKVKVNQDFKPDKLSKKISIILSIISLIIFSFILMKYGFKIISLRNDRIVSGDFFLELEAKYKLKNLLFLNICSTSILFWQIKKNIVFIPLLLIGMLEIFSGGRTYLFLIFLFIYFNNALYNKKIYIVRISIVAFILLSYTTLTRLNVQARVINQNKSIEFFYNSLGEFIQTYNTFPYILQKKEIILIRTEEMLLNLMSGILPGFLKNDLLVHPGVKLAKEIDRGYGLGLNILTEIVYYFDSLFITIFPIILILLIYFFNRLFIKFNFIGYLFIGLFIVYLRLIFREGLWTYLLTIFYIGIFYFNFSFFNYKKVFFVKEIE